MSGTRAKPGLHAVVAPRDHHAVRRGEDVLEVLVGLDLLDLRDDPRVRPALLEQVDEADHVDAVAHEGQRDEVRAHLDGDVEVGQVLLGDGGQRRARVGDVDALVGQQRAGGDGARDDACPSLTLSVMSRGTPSPMTISERSVTRSAEAVEGDADGVGVRVGAVAAEDDAVARLQAALDGVAREADLRALQVEQEADGPARAVGGGAQLDGAAAQVLVRAVRAVDARAVHARAR